MLIQKRKNVNYRITNVKKGERKKYIIHQGRVNPPSKYAPD